MEPMTEVADLYVVLRSVGAKFEEGMARAGASAEAADSKISALKAGVRTMALATVGGGLLVAGAALKMSSEFDRLMQQIHTLAHVPEAGLKQLSAGVLDVAGKVGFAPNSLAEALYHIESTFASTGINGKKALSILTTASKGAQIGGADLVDVVNALDAAVVSGIPGVHNINDAMGALLATVGAGDMTMQNLAESLGTGILAVGKQYGATLADIGAGLATFGDNNIRGSKAATELRMAIMDLTMQSGKGAAVLKDTLGLAIGQLGRDMQTGGLKKALEDLHNHLNAVGITGTRVGEVLGEAFTKKSSAPLAILLGELGQFESKYPELKKGANAFGDAWAHTAQLISTKAKMAKANVEGAFIGLGHALQPIAAKVLDVFNGAFAWAKTHKKAIEEIAHALMPLLYGALVMVGVVLAEMAIEMAIAAAPFILIAAAIGFAIKAFMNLYEHNAKVRAFVQTVVAGFKRDAVEAVHWLMNAFQEAKRVVGEVIAGIVGFYHEHQAAINHMVTVTVSILKDIWKAFQEGFQAVKAVVETVIKIVVNLWDRFGKHLLEHLMTAWNAIVEIVKGAFQVVKGIFEIVTGILTGHWSKFWKGIKDVVAGIWHMISGAVKAGINEISTLIGEATAVISAVWDLVWHTVESVASDAWKGIQEVFAPVVGFFETIGKGVVTAWNNVVSFFRQLPGRILSYLAAAGRWLLHVGEDIIKGLLAGLRAATVGVFQWVVSQGGMIGIGEKIMNALYMGMKAAWGAVESFFKHLPGWILDIVKTAGTWLLNTGKRLLEGLGNGIIAAATWVWNFFRNLPGEILRFLGNAASWLYHIGIDVINGIMQGIYDTVQMLWSWAGNLAQGLFNAVGDVYSWMLSVGKNLIIGIWNGIVSLSSWLWDKVSSFCSNLWHSILSFFGISSPSKLMKETVGKHLVTGIAAGIMENQHLVHDAMKRLANDTAKTKLNVGNISVGGVPANGSGPLSGGHGVVGSGNTVYYVTVQGQLVDTAGFFRAMQTAAQQHGARNPKQAGLVYSR
jgi:TP901 family phage tail tape measure protein